MLLSMKDPLNPLSNYSYYMFVKWPFIWVFKSNHIIHLRKAKEDWQTDDKDRNWLTLFCITKCYSKISGIWTLCVNWVVVQTFLQLFVSSNFCEIIRLLELGIRINDLFLRVKFHIMLGNTSNIEIYVFLLTSITSSMFADLLLYR